MEIAEVCLEGADARQTLYWFLFEDDRLISWGRPEEWRAAARSYRVDVPYRPEPRPSEVQANVTLVSGR